VTSAPAPAAKVDPLEENAKDQTGFLKLISNCSRAWAKSHSRTVPSPLAVATVLPSGESLIS
jgi:hypothetical protein